MLVFALICVALGTYRLWRWRKKSTEPPMMPGGWPIVGHAHMLLGDSSLITDPDDGFTVANTCLQKDGFYDFVKPWVGEGLVSATLSVWRKHRKLLNPAFSQVVLDGFLGVFNSQSRRLVHDLASEAEKGPFNHWTYMRHHALVTVCLTALGVDISDDTVLNKQYVEAIDQIFNTIVDRFQKFWWHSPFMFRFSNIKKKQDKYVKILHKMTYTILQKRKSELNSSVRTENANEKFLGSKFKPFLDLLLELAIDKGVFNDREIREHVDTIIVSGHDTSANVLMLKEIFGDSDRDVEKHDLSQLVYLEAILKESMRIYTIVPVVARRLDKDVKLKNYTLSAGRTCAIFICGIHRHQVWGPDVDQFKPERWMNPTTLPDNPNAFAGFAMGRRICIGKAYALMSMKTTLAHVLRRYRISADHTKLQLKLDVMLKPVKGYYISIEKRQ